MSLPETPKSRTWPLTSLEYPTPVKQRGHHVTAIGCPPTTSFTISCLLSNGTEYARASPSISTPSTSSSGPYSSPASSAETNEGLEIDGMASGGRRVTISYSRSGVGTGVGGGVLVAIGFAVFLCGVGVTVAVSGRGVGCSTAVVLRRGRCGRRSRRRFRLRTCRYGFCSRRRRIRQRSLRRSRCGLRSRRCFRVRVCRYGFRSRRRHIRQRSPLRGRRGARSNGRRRRVSRPGSLTRLSRLSASQRQDDDHDDDHN